MYFMCRATQLTISLRIRQKNVRSRGSLFCLCVSYIFVEKIYVIAVMHVHHNQINDYLKHTSLQHYGMLERVMKLSPNDPTLTNKFFCRIRNNFEEKFVCKNCQFTLFHLENIILNLTSVQKVLNTLLHIPMNSGAIIQIRKKSASNNLRYILQNT